MNKVELIKAMNEIVLATTDEDNVIDTWLRYGVPDEPTDEDFKFIANNEDSFKETVECFIILSKHFKEGLKLFGKWYGTK